MAPILESLGARTVTARDVAVPPAARHGGRAPGLAGHRGAQPAGLTVRPGAPEGWWRVARTAVASWPANTASSSTTVAVDGSDARDSDLKCCLRSPPINRWPGEVCLTSRRLPCRLSWAHRGSCTREAGAPSPRTTRVVRLFSRLNIGGPSVHVILLTAGLREKGYDTRLIIGREAPSEGNLLDMARRMEIQVEQLGGLGREIRPLADLVTLWQLYRMIRRWQPRHRPHPHREGRRPRAAGRPARRRAHRRAHVSRPRPARLFRAAEDGVVPPARDGPQSRDRRRHHRLRPPCATTWPRWEWRRARRSASCRSGSTSPASRGPTRAGRAARRVCGAGTDDGVDRRRGAAGAHQGHRVFPRRRPRRSARAGPRGALRDGRRRRAACRARTQGGGVWGWPRA